MTYAGRALLDFWDFAVAGGFLLFLSLRLSALAFPAPLGRRAAETGGRLRFEVCNVTEAFSPARSRAAKKVLSLASWSGHQLTHRPSHTDRPLRKPLLCVHDSRRPVCLVAEGCLRGSRCFSFRLFVQNATGSRWRLWNTGRTIHTKPAVRHVAAAVVARFRLNS
jgi:hypothetical protein